MSNRLSELTRVLRALSANAVGIEISGCVAEASSTYVTLRGLSEFANLGDLVSIETQTGAELMEIAQISGQTCLAIPFRKQSSTRLGDIGRLMGRPRLSIDASWKGRVIDPLGNPIDDGPPLTFEANPCPIDSDPPLAMNRNRVLRGVRTGVKAIDIFTPLCAGQRMGIFAGSGVGKSTLLAMLSSMPDVSTVVIALVGERGREVREFLEDTLGARRERVVAVVATGDDSAAMRRLAPKSAMAVAEHFRDRGEQVLLMIDSLTRFAHAQREYALACNEPPVARGYPPSVFAEIARLLERGGPGPRGSGDITMIATVLVDGDDHNEPISDAARGILDGHIVLDRKIAASGRWPAIDILSSLSRLDSKTWSPRQLEVAQAARALVARFEETKDLRLIGGYQPGSDQQLDLAVKFVPRIYELMTQPINYSGTEDPYTLLERILQSSPQSRPVPQA